MIRIVIKDDNKEKAFADFKKASLFVLTKYRERLFFKNKKKHR
jgi:hypothetical protein